MTPDRDSIDPTEDHMHEALQALYRQRRRRWAWRVGRPYSHDQEREPPAVIDGADSEAG